MLLYLHIFVIANWTFWMEIGLPIWSVRFAILSRVLLTLCVRFNFLWLLFLINGHISFLLLLRELGLWLSFLMGLDLLILWHRMDSVLLHFTEWIYRIFIVSSSLNILITLKFIITQRWLRLTVFHQFTFVLLDTPFPDYNTISIL